MLTTAALFGNHMILQRDKLVPIWGAASPGAMVSVSYQGKDFSGLAGQDGRWKFDIGPFSTSWGEEMTISDGTETIRLADVACGEVWLAGGQSNMEFFMRYDTGCAVEKEGCAALPIRFFDFPEISYREQLKDADYSAEFGFWRLSAPEQLEWFSAVGYYFAKYLCQNLRIPVGVIGFNWGGTSILCWMSREAISHGKGEVFLEKYDASIRGLDLKKYQKSFRSNPHNFHNRMILSPELDQMLYGISHEEQEALMRTPPKGSRPQPMGPWDPMRPAGLYETMLLQITPYGIRGFLWYLGKSDCFRPKAYRTLFPALIENWRELWGRTLPFLFVQLAPFHWWMGCDGGPFPELRQIQQETADSVPGTGMAVITDAGTKWDIHPENKRPVGERLALLAESIAYGQDILCEAPRLQSAKREGGKITLTFAYAGEGLQLTGKLSDAVSITVEGTTISDYTVTKKRIN